jgi:hypothetical protein
MDVDPMELMLQMLVLHISHVIDHFQNNKAGKNRQHKSLLEEARSRADLLHWPINL